MKKAMGSKSSSSSSGSSGGGGKSSNKMKYKKIDDTQLKCAFQMFDTNHDGKLNHEEMRNMIASIGGITINNFTNDSSQSSSPSTTPTFDSKTNDKLIGKIFKEASSKSDHHDLISEQDFLNWFSRFKTPKDDDVEADLKAAFSVFDKDKNGYITRDELKSAMLIMDEKLSEKDLDELLKTTDLDRDGKINYEEFIKTLL